MKPSSTESCVKALRVLSQDIQSEDGVANAALAECADRMERLAQLLVSQEEHINRLEEAGDRMVNEGWNEPHLAGLWRQAKENKP